MKNFKPLFGFTLAIAFLILGIFQIQSNNTFSKTIGYISIVFWSSILLFAIYTKITTKKTNH